jgi:hypothetical protein
VFTFESQNADESAQKSHIKNSREKTLPAELHHLQTRQIVAKLGDRIRNKQGEEMPPDMKIQLAPKNKKGLLL